MLESDISISSKANNRFPRGIWFITWIGVLNSLAFSISLPYMALYLHDQRGISMSIVGVLIMGSGVISGLTQLYGGVIVDRVGRRSLLITTLSLSSIFYVGMAVSIGIDAPVGFIIFIYTLVRSVLMMQRPAINAIVVDLAPKSRLAETFGVLRIGMNLGWAAGPAIGGFLAATLTYAWVFGIGAGVIVIALFCIVLFFKETFTSSATRISISSVLSTAKDRNLLGFTLISLLLFIAMSQMGPTLSVYTVSYVGFSTAQYGLLLTVNGLIIVVLQYPITRILGRLPLRAVLTLSSLLYGIGYLTMGWVGPYGLAVSAMIIITLGEIVFGPVSLTVVGEMAAGEWRGRYMAFYGLSDTLGMALGPLLGGILLDLFPSQPLFLWGVIGALALIAAVGFNRYRVKKTVR